MVVRRWAYQTANRLDRLHVRYDLSWQALDGALGRRAVVARAVAVDAYGSGAGRQAAGRAGRRRRTGAADRRARPPRTNCRPRSRWSIPASLPVALVAELADAEARVLLARRFHNDAVRDTLALRERPLVRWLRLGGTAALPTYFEIAERAAPTIRRRRSAAARRRASCCSTRTAAVLLFCGSDPAADADGGAALVVHRRRRGPAGGDAAARPPCASSPRRPACASSPADLDRAGVAARRGDRLQRVGDPQRGDVLRATARARFEPSTRGRTALERRYIHGHRWCDATTIGELVGKAARRSTRCSSASCSPRRTRWSTAPGVPASSGELQSIR